ncbi:MULTISPECIES: ATP-binding protein [unclassified Streptomyces]|jgi:anti-sigma regulatory factor (Ser/Thr protein kinase)|uniref:ATP-binding protein n=1 Tax=Streptomyces sp. R08 TaxID=3238624 RepID=A0AB39MKR3_9ACTN|nr:MULTISPECIES: ATP-binding protein [unclassified Streptomyces]MCX4817536.1 ATP-binding protein [Streptomyces sp. NBC_01239]
MDSSSLRAVGWARTLPLNSEVKSARDWARRHLDALGWTTTAPETADAVVLTVSELVTNAHRHAHSSAQLVMTCDDHCLHVSVHDRSSEMPTPRDADMERLGGRGMLLVDAVADTWETRPCPHGKSVSACFHAPEAKPQTAGSQRTPKD